MTENKFGRRKFLKLTVAAVTAAGLSHFKFLNFGPADVASNNVCDPAQGLPDICDPLNADPDECWNVPVDEDLCSPDPLNPDVCPEPGGGPAQDFCDPLLDPDACDPFDQPPDDPNRVMLASVDAKSPLKTVLGGVVALVAGAVIWVQHRLSSIERKED